VRNAEAGVVEQVRRVKIPAQSSTNRYIGAGIGGVLGGLAGNSIGSGHGRTASTIALGTLGALAGETVASRMSERDQAYVEVVVRLDSGGLRVIPQPLDQGAVDILPGDCVWVVPESDTPLVQRQCLY